MLLVIGVRIADRVRVHDTGSPRKTELLHVARMSTTSNGAPSGTSAIDSLRNLEWSR